MRIYLTHCSAEKDFSLKESGKIVPPDQLYTNPHIQQFMARCKDKNVDWAILSDLYGIYLSNEQHGWYEKHPDTVTPQEANIIIQDFNHKLSCYDEIWFYVRPEAFHPFYQTVLQKTVLADRVELFQDIGYVS